MRVSCCSTPDPSNSISRLQALRFSDNKKCISQCTHCAGSLAQRKSEQSRPSGSPSSGVVPIAAPNAATYIYNQNFPILMRELAFTLSFLAVLPFVHLTSTESTSPTFPTPKCTMLRRLWL